MEKMDKLNQLVKRNEKNSSYIRKSLSDFMKHWEKVTENCETVASRKVLYSRYEQTFHLVTGERELKCIEEYRNFTDISENAYFPDILGIDDIRYVCKHLPDAISEIIKELAQIEIESEKIIADFQKFKEVFEKHSS